VRNLTTVRDTLLGMAKDRIKNNDTKKDVMGLLCGTEPYKSEPDTIVDLILAILLAGSLTQ